MSLLSKLVELANRPGTPAEGAAARARAERLAAEEGLGLVEVDGTLLALDEHHAELHRALMEIADPPERPEIA